MVDRATERKELGTVSFPVDRSKLAELARAFHDEDAAWHDPAVAAKSGFDGVPVPPTVTVLADHWRPDGALTHALAMGIEPGNLLHGEVSWEYLRAVRLGDELTGTTTVTGVRKREGKRGGTMTMIDTETTFTNQRGELALRRRDTLIETGARP